MNSLQDDNPTSTPILKPQSRPQQSLPKVSIRIRRWRPVGVWKYNVTVNENCPICHVEITQYCIGCSLETSSDTSASSSSSHLPNTPSGCSLIFGRCGHVFHSCCIDEWIKNNKLCPYCFGEWIVDKTQEI